MYTLKLKTVRDTSGTLPHVTLQSPNAKLGVNMLTDARMVTTEEITEIPDDVPSEAVVRLWQNTCYMGWLGKDPRDGDVRRQFAFAELGAGKIIR